MPRLLGALVALCSLLLAGCGSGRIDFAGHHRPAPPVDLSVYVDNGHVRVSPARVGAGAVAFDIANQASKTERLVITRADGRTVASTGPIDARSTAQVTVAFTKGHYRLVVHRVCPSDCPAPLTGAVSPAALTIGPARASGDSALLQP